MKQLFYTLCMTIVIASCKKDRSESLAPDISPLDAKFTVTGTMTEFKTGSGFSGHYPFEIVLEKSGDRSGTMVPTELGIPGHLILSTGSGISNVSYFSNFAVVVTIDPSTNKITAITNHYGQPSPNGRSATLDPSGVNAWDPATRKIRIKYWMDEPAVVMPHRAAFDEVWTYAGPR